MALTHPDGTKRSLAYHTVGKMGARTFHFPRILAALTEAGTSVSYLGSTTRNSSTLHRIEVDKKWAIGLPKNLTSLEFQIDSLTNLVASIEDQFQPEDNANDNFPRVVSFGDYRLVGGVVVPFAITEDIAGQRMWSMQFSSINFNAGLSDADFRP